MLECHSRVDPGIFLPMLQCSYSLISDGCVVAVYINTKENLQALQVTAVQAITDVFVFKTLRSHHTIEKMILCNQNREKEQAAAVYCKQQVHVPKDNWTEKMF